MHERDQSKYNLLLRTHKEYLYGVIISYQEKKGELRWKKTIRWTSLWRKCVKEILFLRLSLVGRRVKKLEVGGGEKWRQNHSVFYCAHYSTTDTPQSSSPVGRERTTTRIGLPHWFYSSPRNNPPSPHTPPSPIIVSFLLASLIGLFRLPIPTQHLRVLWGEREPRRG